MTRAAEVYAQRLAEYGTSADTRFSVRVQRIADGLIRQAKRDYPVTAAWSWEVNVISDEGQSADSMAGGKILVSQAYVERLELNDPEVAMLLAHEIAHAALLHNLQEYRQAIQLDPTWAQRPFSELEDAVDNDRKLVAQLTPLNHAQEAEADRAGLQLAFRAGWPAQRLANYFKKLMHASGWPNHGSDAYPSPVERWHAAQELATRLSLTSATGQPGQ